MDVFVARQPIFDAQRRIHAYELLFRDGAANAFPGVDGDTATSQLLSHTFWNLGLDRLGGGHPVFVNFTADLLCRQVPTMFPRESLVVEVLEDVPPTRAVVDACRRIVAEGYPLALDDFFFQPDLAPLVRLASVLKIDFRASPPADSRRLIERLAPTGMRFLAEKVETPDEYRQARELGYSYFQGYFFARPEVVRGRDIAPARANLLLMVAEVNRSDLSMDRVERYVMGDVSISYKLLRYINSAYFRRVQEITSLHQALMLLGEREVRRFVSLVAAAELSAGKPTELMRTAIVRARLCELLGRHAARRQEGAELFLLGLFSLIDAMLDDTMDRLVGVLPVSERVKRALTARQGELADYLRLVMAYERMAAADIDAASGRLGIDPHRLPGFYLDALGWASGLDAIGHE